MGLIDNWIYMLNFKIVKYCIFLMEMVVFVRYYKRYDFKMFLIIIYVMYQLFNVVINKYIMILI